MASVSPDGSAVVMAGQKNAGQSYNQNENAIWLVTTGPAAPLESKPIQGRAPAWSPDGRRIAFESDRGSPNGQYAAFIVNRDGSGLLQVTDYALWANHPVFSPDGKRLVISVGDPAKNISNIAVVDLP
jgi:Tol biopolymer transport system component